MCQSEPTTLYNKLEDHFNAAAAKYPQHANTFKEKLVFYKDVFNGSIPVKSYAPDERLAEAGISARPSEVREVFKEAYRIWQNHRGPFI